MILVINTAENNKIITALAFGKKILTEKIDIEFGESDKLLPLIDILFKKNKKSIKDLTAIFVVNGPGSFTSLRIGIAVANAFGLSLQVPVVGVKRTEFSGLRDLIAKGQKKKKTKLAFPYYGAKVNITKAKKKWLI